MSGADTSSDRKGLLERIWQMEEGGRIPPGAWLWWFWIFFIHDKGTQSHGKCRQLMILWSVKNDPDITVNGVRVETKDQIRPHADEGQWLLDGAAAAWYFDGEMMHDSFVLEKSLMVLDEKGRRIIAPGKSPTEFFEKEGAFVTRIDAGGKKFEFRAKQKDMHPAVGPVFGSSRFPLGIKIEGTRIEVMGLSGTEEEGGKKSGIAGTAYFQKILLAAPPTQWYWGMYHFSDGSYFTYMQPYMGRTVFANGGTPSLRKPKLTVMSEAFFYHAPSGRTFKAGDLAVQPEKLEGSLWRHRLTARGEGFGLEAVAEAYSHACWSFEKNIGVLPAKSKFHYNEYPSVLKRLVIREKDGKEIAYENGWGNMENSWGLLI